MKYFIKPKFYPDFPNGIHSVNLKSLFNASDALEYLRKLYRTDTLKFYSVRDELILRGINFEKKYQSNFFPHFEIEESPQLVVLSPGKMYKNVDFKLLGMPHFITHFNIENDLFFNNLPLYGFTFLSKNISLEFVLNVFDEAGFMYTATDWRQAKSTKKIDESNIDQEKVIHFAQKYLENGYAFTYDIYSDLQFDESLSKLINKFQLDNVSKLSFFLKKAIPGLQDNSNFLSLPNSTITSTEAYIISNYVNKLSRKELIEFLNSKGYSIPSANRIIQKLLNSNNFFQVDSEIIINRRSISFEIAHKNSLNKYLNTKFADEEFLTVSNLIGFRSELPSLNIGPWTMHLIFCFAKEIGYKSVDTFSNHRYEKLILTKAQTNIKNYFELIHYILKNKYTGSLHHNDVREYLSSVGVVNFNTNLINTLKYSSLFSIDEFGWISFKNTHEKK